MTKFLVDKAANIPEDHLRSVTFGGKEILFVKNEGKYFAINNICSHSGAKLHEGILEKNILVCPWHGAKWNIRTGKLVWFTQSLENLESYNVVVENDHVFVEI